MPTIEERALALVNEVRAERGYSLRKQVTRCGSVSSYEALCRTLETHDAERAAHAQFRQEVSDAVRQYERELDGGAGDFAKLRRFILPKPVHPIVQAAADIGRFWDAEMGVKLEAALAKRGLKLVEVGDAD